MKFKIIINQDRIVEVESNDPKEAAIEAAKMFHYTNFTGEKLGNIILVSDENQEITAWNVARDANFNYYAVEEDICLTTKYAPEFRKFFAQ